MLFSKYTYIGAFIFLGFIAFIFFEVWQKVPDGNFSVIFLQETRGDAIYMKTSHGKEVLVDGGEDSGILLSLKKYRPFWDRYIDVIIITHPDSDHYYGALEVIKRFDVGKIFLTGALKNDPKYKEVFELAKEKKIDLVFAYDETDFLLDGVSFDFLYPFEPHIADPDAAGNNYSLVFKTEYNGKKILFTGDIEQEAEKLLLQSGKNLQADVLKIPHHGSKTSSSVEFITAVNPTKIFVQVGTQNKFGHPHQEIIDRYKGFSLEIQSSKNGDKKVLTQ